MVQIREDLKINPEYLNELISVLENSIKNLSEENKRLRGSIGKNGQVNLIELQDKVEMLNRRFFNKGKEFLNKSRPPKDNQKELLPHNVPPIDITSNHQENVPEVDIVHTEATWPYCGNTDLSLIKDQFEESMEHDLQAKSVIRKKHRRQKYRCKSCDKIVTAKGPAKVRPKSKYSIGFSVGVAIDKYSYHLPLERISRQFQEQGLKIDTKTLFSQTEAVYLNLAPILDKMKEEITSYGYVHVDETRGKILSNSTNGFIWSMCNKCGAYFQFETTRSGAVAEEMLGNFSGTIINDGFSGYNRFRSGRKIKVANCWSHARRKFFDCLSNYPKAEDVIDLIDKLFEIEHKSKGSFKRLGSLRKTKSKKVIDELHELLLKLERESLPRSGLGKAINYTLNLWIGLTEFINDAKIPLTNNLAERVLRNPVKGRDNYLGYRTINGADVAMFYYSIIETCKLLRINPRAYLIEQSERHWEKNVLQTPLEWAKSQA